MHSMSFIRTTLTLVWLVCVAMLIASCSTGSKPARFYLLTPMPEGGDVPPSAVPEDTPRIGVGPLSFPDYLLRPPIATYSSANELYYAEFDRWAESLGDNFARVLAMNLSDLLGTDNIVTYPWQSTTPVTYQLTVEVSSFELRADGDVWLIARWNVIHRPELKNIHRQKTSIRRTLEREDEKRIDYGALAALMSEMVGELSREIVSELAERR